MVLSRVNGLEYIVLWPIVLCKLYLAGTKFINRFIRLHYNVPRARVAVVHTAENENLLVLRIASD